MLERKGEVSIVERTGGKTMVKVVEPPFGGTMVLEGRTTKEQLAAELFRMIKNWPDKD